jgi:hypothetical protein
MFTPKKQTAKPGNAFESTGNHQVHKERQPSYKRLSKLLLAFLLSSLLVWDFELYVLMRQN